MSAYPHGTAENEANTERGNFWSEAWAGEGAGAGKQCTYNVTLRRVRATIVVVEYCTT